MRAWILDGRRLRRYYALTPIFIGISNAEKLKGFKCQISSFSISAFQHF